MRHHSCHHQYLAFALLDRDSFYFLVPFLARVDESPMVNTSSHRTSYFPRQREKRDRNPFSLRLFDADVDDFVSCSYCRQNLLVIKAQSIANCTFLNLVLGIGQDGKGFDCGLIRRNRKYLLHQLSSNFPESSENKHWIMSRSHGEVLKPVIERVRCGDGPRFVQNSRFIQVSAGERARYNIFRSTFVFSALHETDKLFGAGHFRHSYSSNSTFVARVSKDQTLEHV